MSSPSHLAACVLFLTPLIGCGIVPAKDGDPDQGRADEDADGDGHTIADGDCDDTDASIHPDALDTPYDGIDSDCSGGSDNDADADGYDDASRGGDDCDDADATRNPGADESYEDDIDSDCDGYADAGSASCATDFTITFPDGSASAVDGCAAFDMSAAYEFDPDETPTMVALGLEFNAWSDEAFECTVSLELSAVCEPGYYLVPGASIGWATFDCTGAPNEYEADYAGMRGWIALDVIDTGDTPGNFSGRPLYASVEGTVWAESTNGVVLEGRFDVGAEQIAIDADVVPECVVVDGDVDGDGFVTEALGGEDCDDGDPDVHPGIRSDDCNATDDDCDGSIDEDGSPVSWYEDADGDGYGSGGELVVCTPPAGYSLTDDDCDDARAAVHPGATEVVADGRDQDCDGVDSCYSDDDFDGYGDTLIDSSDLDCTDRAEAATDGDCDDGARFVNPGTAEQPADGIDNDCDGAEICYADLDGDGQGSSDIVASSDLDCTDLEEAASDEDCDDGDASSTTRSTDEDCDGSLTGDDCDDTDATVSPAAADDTFDGVDNDCDGIADDDAYCNRWMPFENGASALRTYATAFNGSTSSVDVSITSWTGTTASLLRTHRGGSLDGIMVEETLTCGTGGVDMTAWSTFGLDTIFTSPRTLLLADSSLTVGSTWTYTATGTDSAAGWSYTDTGTLTVTDQRTVTVAAGTFDALIVEHAYTLTELSGTSFLPESGTMETWYVAGLGPVYVSSVSSTGTTLESELQSYSGFTPL